MSKGKTTTSGMDWNTMIGLTDRLKRDSLDRDYLLIILGCYFGLRISDLLSIRWDDVLEKEELVIIESKTKKRRLITINPRVKEAIQHCHTKIQIDNSHWKGEYVLSNQWGGKISVSYINRRLKLIFKKYNVKVQNPSSHTLRKSFGRRIWDSDNQSERSLIYLSEIFNHSSTTVTRRYIGITEEKIADVYLNL
jgi:integrase